MCWRGQDSLWLGYLVLGTNVQNAVCNYCSGTAHVTTFGAGTVPSDLDGESDGPLRSHSSDISSPSLDLRSKSLCDQDRFDQLDPNAPEGYFTPLTIYLPGLHGRGSCVGFCAVESVLLNPLVTNTLRYMMDQQLQTTRY
jgi:hypothetical protein